MRETILFLCVGLVGGFAISTWWSGDDADEAPGLEQPMLDREPSAASADRATAALVERVAVLEHEIEALRRDLAQLVRTNELVSFNEEAEATDADFDPRAQPIEPDGQSVGDGPSPANERRFRLRSSEGRIEALTAAGFSLDRAEQIERRVEQLRVEAMQARYDAARRGGGEDLPNGSSFDWNAMLRAELGDADYERYLTAMRRSTTVDVSSVLSSSAAERAGMSPGDQIVAYGGQRIFDMRDLNQALLEGEPGEPVVVDIVRDGQPMQLVMPRGPLGISGGFGRGRGR